MSLKVVEVVLIGFEIMLVSVVYLYVWISFVITGLVLTTFTVFKLLLLTVTPLILA